MEGVTSESNKCLVENEAGKESMNGQPSKEVFFGDLLWVKLKKSSWWPAQIVDENTVSVVDKPHRKGASGYVLVRLYGSYIYKYVDIHKSRAEFKNILVENNFNHFDILKKYLERDLPSLNSGRSKRRQQSKSKGTAVTEASQNGSTEKDMSDKSQLSRVQVKASSKKRAKTAEPHLKSPKTKSKNEIPELSTPNTVTSRPQEKSARRMKVMQTLGLVAPTGSPFPRNGFISHSPTALT